MSLEERSINDLRFLSDPRAEAAGLRHAFLVKPWNARAAAFEQNRGRLFQAFGIQQMHFLKQVHGSRIQVWDQQLSEGCSSPEADAWVARRSGLKGTTALALLTADCCPILIYTRTHLALIHAGWRGLASALIPDVLSALSSPDIAEFHVILGPCAGQLSYLVQEDVIKALGDSAAYARVEGRGFLLSLEKTLLNKIRQNTVLPFTFSASAICTITNECCYSYRREGSSTGRNLSFCIL